MFDGHGAAYARIRRGESIIGSCKHQEYINKKDRGQEAVFPDGIILSLQSCLCSVQLGDRRSELINAGDRRHGAGANITCSTTKGALLDMF